jgi:hypothetical protein
MKMGDRNRGLYSKFTVERTDGQSALGKKHEDCDYFVLDLNHDPHAVPAVLAYAQSCHEDGYELLARDLKDTISKSGAEILRAEMLSKKLERNR